MTGVFLVFPAPGNINHGFVDLPNEKIMMTIKFDELIALEQVLNRLE
jgi:hypothetical protein